MKCSILLPIAAVGFLAGCMAYPPYGPPPPPPPYGQLPPYQGGGAIHTSLTLTLPIGGSGQFNGITLRPLAIVEDSRCPAGAQCIRAGTLKVLVAIDGPAMRQQRTLELGRPQPTPAGMLTLTQAPPKPSNGTIPPAAYLLTFTVNR